jgi:glycine dehydrogenase subunit 1
MVFTPHTAAEIESMLRTIGVGSVDELFAGVPDRVSYDAFTTLPEPHSELEAAAECRRLAARNCGTDRRRSFLGAGAYEHFIPAAVDQILLRGEFYTAYTPYQPEASQGTLRAIYEYQSMISLLTGLEVSNASLYDGASAVAEAVLMALRQKRRTTVALPRGLHPAYRAVIETYTQYLRVNFVEFPFADGVCNPAALDALDVGNDLAAAIVAQPNALGCIEPAEAIAAWAHDRGGLCIAVVNPLSLGVLKAPGDWGADIAVGEGQPLGIPLQFGGPYFGFMATRKALARNLPGRICGRTVDLHGREGYVLTLQTREQHIRREKATSNICTNQALLALAATVYLALLGKQGLREVGVLNLDRSHYLLDQVAGIKGVAAAWPRQPFFNEFVLRLPRPAEEVVAAMKQRDIIAGWPLARWSREWGEDALLVCATEVKTKRDCEEYASALREAL